MATRHSFANVVYSRLNIESSTYKNHVLVWQRIIYEHYLYYHRIIYLYYHRHPRDNIDDICKKYAILKVSDKFKFEICCFVYKFHHRLLFDCFNNFFQRNSEVYSRQIRQSNNLNLPLFKKSICKQSIKFVGVKLWNEIPNEIKRSKNLTQFKKKMKQYLLNSYLITSFL